MYITTEESKCSINVTIKVITIKYSIKAQIVYFFKRLQQKKNFANEILK